LARGGGIELGIADQHATAVRFGSFAADLTSGELYSGGTRIRLQEQPFKLLTMLVGRPGELVTREEMRRELWPEDSLVDFDHGINVAIKKIRAALGETPSGPRFIETVGTRGYRFIEAVVTTSAPVAAQPARRLAGAAVRTLCPILVERNCELESLEEAWLAATSGEGQVVSLSADAGLGKTRLALELAGLVRQGRSTVLWGAASQAASGLPFLPFREAVGNYLASREIASIQEGLGQGYRELLPVLPKALFDDGHLASGQSPEEKLRLFEAIVALLGLVSKSTAVLVVLEDLHWADASSCELLDFLTRRLKAMAVMVLATYRPDEIDRKHPLLPVILGWRRNKIARLIDLHPLTEIGVSEMLNAIMHQKANPEFTALLHRRSEGNPFVLEEFVKVAMIQGDSHWEHAGRQGKDSTKLTLPATVRDVILVRVDCLEEDHADTLRAAAVLGEAFSYRVLESVAGKAQDVVSAAIQAARREQLIVEDTAAHRYRFRHALTREAIYDDLVLPVRDRLHGRAADVLATDPAVEPSELAHHLLAARREKEAVPVCLSAGERSLARHGYHEAGDWFGRVAGLVGIGAERAEALRRAGEAYWVGGQMGAAIESLNEAIPLYEEAGRNRDVGRCYLLVGRCHWENDRPENALNAFERARLMLEPFGPSEDLALAYTRLAAMNVFDWEGARACKTAQRAVEIAEAVGSEAMRKSAANYMGCGLVLIGRAEEGLQYLYQSGAFGNAIVFLVDLLRARDGESLLQQLKAETGGHVSLEWANVPHFEYLLAFHQGDLARALAAGRELLARAVQVDVPHLLAHAHSEIVAAATELDMLEEAAVHVPEVPGAGLNLDSGTFLISALIRYFVAINHTDRLPSLTKIFIDSGSKAIVRPRLLDLAIDAMITCGQLDQAATVLAVLKVQPMKKGDPWLQRAEGRIMLANGESAAAIPLFAASAARFRGAGYGLDEAVSQMLLGSAQLAVDRQSAESTLWRSIEIADAIGARLVARQARGLLPKVGVDHGVRAAHKAVPRHS
jgi:DNA-binding winged helix-turn-helix (wHTH) protein/tetratricopeptide (TPR) repeat protein